LPSWLIEILRSAEAATISGRPDCTSSLIIRPMKTRKFVLIFTVAFLLFFRFAFGLYVVQPIGAIPEGATIVYWRLGTNMDFVESADGLVLKTGAGLSLLTRGLAISTSASVVADRKVLKLPYSSFLYGLTTNGRFYDR